MRGLEAFASGASLTDAALDAGFANSAHFSRTFRRMFGTAAAALDVMDTGRRVYRQVPAR